VYLLMQVSHARIEMEHSDTEDVYSVMKRGQGQGMWNLKFALWSSLRKELNL